jgi:nitric oxide reductase NorE protein
MNAIENGAENPRSFFTPPGGLLIWLFILVELLTFGGAIGAFLYHMNEERQVLLESQPKLNLTIAVVNTLVLLTSGYFAALGVAEYKLGRRTTASRWTLAAAALGSVFLVLKGFEYAEKVSADLMMETNSFFAFYWALTGFHFIHVLLGISILVSTAISLRRKVVPGADVGVTPEMSASFWHLCDLIWVLIFPILYLYHPTV